MPDSIADCFEILDRQRVPPPLVLTGDNIFTRVGSDVYAVNFHRGIMGYRDHCPQAIR